MSDGAERTLRRAHSSPGRLRLRLPWLAEAPGEAEALADRLAELEGLHRVEIRARTGSVLCHFDDSRLDPAAIIAAVCEHTGAIEGDERAPSRRPRRRRPGSLGRVLARSASGINEDLLDATEGRLDLGTLAALGFLAVGAGEIALTRKLPVPPWFNLAWWAFRTLTVFESEADIGDESDRVADP